MTPPRRLLMAAAAAVAMLTAAPAMAEDEVAREDTLIVGTMWESLPLSMKPRRSRFFNESEILDTLIKLDYDMNLVPGLATSWERVSPKVWRFQLREGVVFHDGTPLTADAVRNSLQRVVELLAQAHVEDGDPAVRLDEQVSGVQVSVQEAVLEEHLEESAA